MDMTQINAYLYHYNLGSCKYITITYLGNKSINVIISKQVVTAHACLGHTLQSSADLSVKDNGLVIDENGLTKIKSGIVFFNNI